MVRNFTPNASGYNPQYMEIFDDSLVNLLKSNPGLSKARIAEALKMELNDDFRNQMDQACDKDLAHKMMDKYYPGSRKAY